MTPRNGALGFVVLVGLDTLALFSAYHIAIKTRVSLNQLFNLRFSAEESFLLLPTFLFMLLICLFAFLSVGLYNPSKQQTALEVLGRVVCGSALSVLLIISTTFFLSRTLYSRSLVGTLLIFNVLAVGLFRLSGRYVLALLRRRGLAVERVAIVGSAEQANRIAERLDFPGSEMKIEGMITSSRLSPEESDGQRVLGRIEELEFLVNRHNLQRVLLSDPALSELDVIATARICEKMGVQFDRTVDAVGTGPTRILLVNGIPLVSLVSTGRSRWDQLAKRMHDFFLSLLLLLALSPLFVIIAAAVRIESAGPVFFKQRRRGKGGRYFSMLKFRSMRVEAEKERQELSAVNEADGALFKIRDDPRMTRVGRILRRFSLDELPQLVNVLWNQMSFIGPRPLPINDIEGKLDDPKLQYWIEKRESVLPGITGLWQIRGRSELGFNEMLALDIFYVKNFSLILDLQILARTLPVVVLGKGAY